MLSTVGSFAIQPLLVVALKLPAAVVMSDMQLARVLGVEALLAVLWVPILRRRGWSLGSATVRGARLDVPRGLGLFAASHVAYVMLYWTAVAVMPRFREVAGAIQIGGTPSLWMVLLVSLVNPIAEEFLYLGFIANVVKSNGVMFAIAAGTLARIAIHVYQGPIGVVGAAATGVVFGVYYVQTGRLWPVIIAHGVADVLALGRLMSGAA